ncbi:MAG: hypothetical protein J0L75_11310 [Spirochaetes bacterium]|nr:hypothetical protein [Spirochaetota bacterium]
MPLAAVGNLFDCPKPARQSGRFARGFLVAMLAWLFALALGLHADGSISISAGTSNTTLTNLLDLGPTKELLLLTIVVSTNENVLVNGINFHASGTGDDSADVSSVRLYQDTGDGIWGGGEAPIGTAQVWSLDDGEVDFLSINQTLLAGSTNYWLLVCDWNPSAQLGKSFRAYVNASDIEAYSTSTNTGAAVSGGPVYGGTVNITSNWAPPRLTPGYTFSTPEYPTTSALTLTINADKALSGGGYVHQDAYDFSGGSFNTTNSYSGSNLAILSPAIRAGNPVIVQGVYSNQRYETVIENTSVFNGPGFVTGLSYYVQQSTSSPTITLKIYTEATNVSNIVSSSSAAVSIANAGSNYIGYAPGTIPVSNDGYRMGTYISRTAARNNLHFAAGAGSGYFLNTSDGTGTNITSYRVVDNLYSMQAIGYATATYDSRILDSGSPTVAYQQVFWNEWLNGGTNEVYMRASNSTVDIANAPWYPATNGLAPHRALTNQQFVQYRVVMTAATNATNAPIFANMRIVFNTNARPYVYVQQAGSTTSNAATWASGTGSGPFVYNYTPSAGFDGVASVYASGWDLLGNGVPTNELVGTFIIDSQTNQITNILCWREPEHIQSISNGVASFREIVSYSWLLSNVPSPSGVSYYYVLDTNWNSDSVTNTNFSLTTNLAYDNVRLPNLTNYFHVRPRSGAGNWGRELVFTNIVYIPPYVVDLGPQTPADAYVERDATNVVAFQIEISANSGDVTLTNATFRATGLSNENGNDLTEIKTGSLRLFIDNNTNGLLDGGDTLLQGNKSFSADNGLVTFTGFSNLVVSNAKKYWILVYDLAGTAADDQTFIVSLLSNADILEKSGSTAVGAPLLGARMTTATKGTLALATGPQNPTSSSIASNANNVPMLQFQVTAGASEDVRITSFAFHAGGSGNDLLDIATGGVKLYLDNNADGHVDGGDTLITGGQSYAFDNGTATFSGLNFVVPAGTTRTLLLATSFNGNAVNGASFSASMTTYADLTAIGDKTGLAIVPTGSLPSGGAKSVGGDQAPPVFQQGSPFVAASPATFTNVTIKIRADEAAYSSGQSFSYPDFTGGYSNTSNITIGTYLTIPSPKIWIGNESNASMTFTGTSTVHDRNTTIDNLQKNTAPGVLTRFITILKRAANPASMKMKVFQTNAGQAYGFVDQQSFPATSAGYKTNTISPTISLTNTNYMLAIYIGNNNGRLLVANAVQANGAFTRAVDDITGTGYSVDNNRYAIYADGYAVSTYTTPVSDSGSGGTVYSAVEWDEILNGGAVYAWIRAGADINTTTNAAWTATGNGDILSGVSNRYFQVRFQLEAAPTLAGAPIVSNLVLYYGFTNNPAVQVRQGGTKYNATFVSNSGLEYTYSYSNRSVNGTADVLVTGFDIYRNATNSMYVGSYLVDGTTPTLSNLKCWQNTMYTQEILSGAVNYDDTVSFNWTDPASPSGTVFYYRYDSTNALTIQSNTNWLTTTTNAWWNDQPLVPGTNYFHLQARNGAGTWGNELLFTNVYIVMPFTVASFISPAAASILNSATNVHLLSLKLTTGTNYGVTISNFALDSSGTGNDSNAIGWVRLYEDNANGSLDGGDTLLASNLIVSDDGKVTFTNLNYAINASDARYWLVLADFAGTALPGDTFSLGISSNSNLTMFQQGTNVPLGAVGLPIPGPVMTIIAPSGLSIAPGASNMSARVISNDALNVPMLQLALSVSGTENLRLTNLVVSASGTGNDLVNIANGGVKLYLDQNGNGAWNAGEPQLGSGATFNSNDGTLQFTNLSLTLLTGTTTNLLVFANFNGTGSNSNSFRVAVVQNADVMAYGVSSLSPAVVSNAPVYGSYMSIGVDITPPFFSPFGPIVDFDPVSTNVPFSIYLQADEPIRSTNGTTTNLYPRVTVVQGNVTNVATWVSGTNAGPFTFDLTLTNTNNVVAEVWAYGFDYSSPAPNRTNQLVGTFVVDTIPPRSFITNYTNFSKVAYTNIIVEGYSTETNIDVSICVATNSNMSGIFSYISNVSFEGSNWAFTNLTLSNKIGYTNWVFVWAVDAAGNESNSLAFAIIPTNAIADPDIMIFRSNTLYSPLTGYSTLTNILLPGTIVEFFIAYTNAGGGAATNFTVESAIPTNFCGFLTNSMVGPGASFAYATNGVYTGYVPSSTVDYAIDRVKFFIGFVASAASGVLRYRVCVR